MIKIYNENFEFCYNQKGKNLIHDFEKIKYYII